MPKKRSKKFKITYFSVDENIISVFSPELKNCSGNTYAMKTDPDAYFRVLPLNRQKKSHIHFFCLNKYRYENLPMVGDKRSYKEEKLPLHEDQGLIEKAYFAFNEKTGEIAFQNNSSNCCHRASFPGIIKGILNNSNIELISKQSDRKLLDNDEVVAFDLPVSFPEPTEKEAATSVEKQGINKAIVSVGEYFEVSGTQKLKLKVTQGRDAKSRGKCVSGKKIKALNKDEGKVTIREKDGDGVDVGFLLIDLAGTPETKEIEVQLDGHYPVEKEIVEKLKACLSNG